MIDIISASNPKVKYVCSLARKKAREENGEYTVEGIKSVNEAVKSGREISSLYVSCSFYEKEEFKYPDNISLCRVTDGIFEKMCDTKAPQGILAVMKMRDEAPKLEIGKPYIYCDGINDPGNLGTIIRTADASLFGGVLLSPDCVDLYNPKTVRSSMGSFFNVKVCRSVTAEELGKYKESGFNLYGGTLSDDSVDYRKADFKKPCIIVVGNEANGISQEISDLCEHIKIPILGKAESLNAAVAAAILMYEALRQRNGEI